MRSIFLLGLVVLLSFLNVSNAQEPDAAPEAETTEDPDAATHEELRELRRGLLAAVEKNDIDGMLTFLHPDAVVTFMDGQQCRGHEEVKGYFDKMLKGDDRLVESYSAEVEVADLTALYGGDFGTSYGTATSDFDLTDGREFTVTGPWTATLVRQDGRWLIATFHSSSNMFDNPILNVVQQWAIWGAVIAGVVGLLLGLVIAFLMRKPKPQANPTPA